MADLIKRQDAIDALLEEVRLVDGYYIENDEVIDKDDAIEAIRLLPSAQPEREKGKWLPDNNNYYEERFICSVCGRSYKVDTCMGKPMWNFCPCGADMR